MRFGVLGMDGHLGDRVSALVDGALSPGEEERAWTHTMGCPGCRRLVEREGQLKSRLSSMSNARDTTPAPADGLIGSLYDVDAWATVDSIERESRRRRSGMMAVGAGSVGAAVIGLVVMTGAPAGLGERAPARQLPAQISTDLPGPQVSPSPAGGGLRDRAR